MKKLSLLILLFTASVNLFAQQIRPHSSSQIFQKLQQLNTLGSVMYLAAHPDDENTRLISYLVHHDHIRTVYLSLTRGDGGQNILGTEQGAALGLIRTHELMEARKIDGAEQAFTSVVDFGFSKSPEETFQFWDKQDLILEVVAQIQKFRPDVLICRFPTTGEGGHGQHTASAIVASEAYSYIQKYNKDHTDQLFLPKRLLFNAYRFGTTSTLKPGQFQVATNHFDPLLGEGYGEMAGKSRSVHKSQGAGTPQSVGIANESFELLAGDPMKHSLYDGIDLSWNRVGKKGLENKIVQVSRQFNFEKPSLSIPQLLEIKKEINTLKDDFWRNQKLKEIDQIILSCAGIMVEVLAENPQATLGEHLDLSVRVIERSEIPVELVLEKGQKKVPLKADSLYLFLENRTLNNVNKASTTYTEPYWLHNPPVHSAYQYDRIFAGLPEQANDFTYQLKFNIQAQEFIVDAPISYKYLSPTRGDVIQRVRIVPPVSIQPMDELIILDSGKTRTVKVQIRANTDIPASFVLYKLDSHSDTLPLLPMKAGQDRILSFTLKAIENERKNSESNIQFSALIEGKIYNQTQHLIQYEHIPELQYFTNASVKVIQKDWKSSVKKIGYIEGVGDYVDDILKLSGLDVSTLSEAEINDPKSLQQYDAIVLGIRALNTKPYLASGMKHLLAYVEKGGTLIVQYNTNTSLVTDDLGPYPFVLSRNRVTEEDAKVTITNPQSPLLNFPNRISQADFKDWVQERGLYFPSQWDKHYKTLFSMHDQQEKPLESAVLYTDYGKGTFIYTSLAFFRQMPAGNVGAIRLMMNLLSAGK